MKKILGFAFAFLMIPAFYKVSAAAVEVSAKSAVLMEFKTHEPIFEKNSSQQLPMASTTKIMTTLLCLESGGLDDTFTVDADAIRVEGSSMGLVEGDIVTKRMLCYGMLLPSGNDAANATAIRLAGSFENFALMMNQRAETIGMVNSHFVTPSGLEADGHHSTAYDMALLACEALKNPDFREICSQSKAKVSFGNPPYERWLSNTNKLLNMYDGVIGVKTGFTDEAGRCLVSACERDGITLICVTLNAPNDWNDHMSLYDYGFSCLKPLELSVPENLCVNIVGSDRDEVPIYVKEPVTIGSADGSLEDISCEVSLKPFLYAPVSEGDYAGEITYIRNDREIASAALYASENAPLITSSENDGFFKTLFRKISDFF